jgi:hypothetical protein
MARGLTGIDRPDGVLSAEHRKLLLRGSRSHSYSTTVGQHVVRRDESDESIKAEASDIRRVQSRKYLLVTGIVSALLCCHRMPRASRYGRHLSGGLAASLCATCICSATTPGPNRRSIKPNIEASLFEAALPPPDRSNYLMRRLDMPASFYFQCEPTLIATPQSRDRQRKA